VCADAGWLADFSDPQAVLDAPFDGRTITATGNPNLSLFDDPSVNRAIREAEKTVDARQRVRAWARVDSLVTAAVPAIPWLWSASLNIRSGNVRARVNPASGRWDLASAQLK
jgi:peptide/nickel transport system substrate-binding protein